MSRENDHSKKINNERIDDLQLEGLKIIQNPDDFCFGIDAVLLSSFAKIKQADKVIDLCTGNGIVPLLLAGKTKASLIHGLEIQKTSADLAKRSVTMNGLDERIEIFQGDLVNLTEGQGACTNIESATYQVVTVNPPYMIGDHGVTNAGDSKTIARHEVLCTLEDILKTSSKLLVDKGRFYMVHKPFRLAEIFTTMIQYKIEPKRMVLVHSKIEKEPSMVLVEGIKGAKSRITVEKPLIVYNEDGSYTNEILKYYGEMK